MLAKRQFDEARIQTVGWRLATGNAAYCRDVAPSTGMTLVDVSQAGEPDNVRRSRNSTADIAVGIVADGSPAKAAGLAANDEVLAIDGVPVSELTRKEWNAPGRAQAALRRLNAGTRLGQVAMTVRRNGGRPYEVTVSGKPACTVHFRLVPENGHAEAAGSAVKIGELFGVDGSAAEQLDGDEFAAAIAHEMAHVLLGHSQWLDQAGRAAPNIRKTEREADRLSIWLLANAGYPPEAGPRLMRGWAARRDPGLPRLPTHDGWENRARVMELEIASLRKTLRTTGQADWSRDFARE